jgi:peptide/nickel transport system substrate-binding protein
MMMFRRGAGSTLGTGMLALLAACGGEPRSGAVEEGGEPEAGGTVVIAENSDMNRPLPTLWQGGFDANLADILYMNLLKGEWRDGRMEYLAADESPMALARGYEYVGEDSAALRYRLRSDVRWSDGTPITAHDVVFTYDMLGDPMVASPRQDFVENIESVVAENDSTVLFTFHRRYPEMVFHSAHGIVPRHAYEGTAPSEFISHPSLLNPGNGGLVVSGPYQVGSWVRGQRLVLTRNPHFEPQGYLDQIIFRIIPDGTTRLVELRTGAIDWMNAVSFDQLPSLRQQAPHLRFEREEKRFYDYIAYNPSVPAFADVDVRRALGLAIDVPGLLAALQMTDFAVPASGPYPPIFTDLYDPEAMPPLPYEPEEAKRILAAKGWSDTDGDGIVEKDGEPFRFTLVTNSGNQRRADISQIVQQQWREIGVDARLQSLEFATFMDGLVRENYEAALGGWGVNLSPDLMSNWGPDAPSNIVSYDDPETLRLMQQALSQPTTEAALPYWEEAATALVEDQPYTWLYYMDQVDGINERVRNVEVDTYGPYQNPWEWWIPRSQQRGAAGPAAADSAP